MDKDYDASLAKCGWDGDPSGWTDFVRRVRLLYEKTPRKKRRQLGPSIVSQLRERAWTITQDVCHQKLTRRDGCVYLLEFLRDRLGRSPIPDIGIRLEELMIRLRRTAGTPMSSWASQVRQTYKRVQVALHRARKEQGTLQPLTTAGSDAAPAKAPSGPSSPSSSSKRGRSSPTRRSSTATQEEPQAEATGEDEDHPEHPSLSPEDEDSFDPGVDAKSSWRRRKDKKKDDEDDESDDSAAMLADLEVWDRYEEGLQEVLPPEVLGWLLLRRANLPTSARLSIQAAAGNSLLFTDIERAMRAMEDELMVHDDSRRQPQHQKRRSFWVEEDGDWSLILAPEEDLQDVISSSEILHIGSRLPQDVYFHQEPDAFQGQLEAGFWHQEDDGAYSYWELAEDGEYYMQDSSGLFWAWNDWDELGTTVSGGGPADGSKESEDAFSLSDPKSRTFTQARQAVRAQKLSRGFYPFNPSTKGKPRGKGKGKGKSKSKGFSSKSHAAPVLAATGEIYAQPGDPSFTGCFVCGAKDHSWRSCPKRSGPSKGGGKGKGGRNFFSESIFMIRSENDEPQPKDQILEYPAMQTPPFSSGDFESATACSGLSRTGMCDFRWDASTCHTLQERVTSVCPATHDFSSAWVVTSHEIGGAFASNSGDQHQRGHAVIDSGATETVGSLPAIEDLMRFRFEVSGTPDHFAISDTPPRRFRFGNGSVGFSLSHVLIPQDLGANRVDLGVYSLDVEKVPILIGIRTLKALRTVLDCSQAVAVFAALDATVGVRLRRSASGHLLLDLSKNWLQDSFSILAPTAGILIASTEPQDQEKKEDSVFVVEPDPVSFHPESHADPHVQAPSEAVELPAVLFHSRGSGHSAPVATAVNSGDFTSDPFWVLRALLAGHGSPDRERLQQEDGRIHREGDRHGQGIDTEHVYPEDQGEGQRDETQGDQGEGPGARLGPHRGGQPQGCSSSWKSMPWKPPDQDEIQPARHVAVVRKVRSSPLLCAEGWQNGVASSCRTSCSGCPVDHLRGESGGGACLQSQAEGPGDRTPGSRELSPAPARTHQGAEGEGDPEECGSGNEAELPDGLGQGFGSDPERSGAFLAYGASRSGGCGPGSSHTGRSGEPSCEPGEQATPGEPNREPGVRSEDWGGQVMSSEDQDVKSLESLAQGLCDRQAFSFADCDRLLHQLATVGAAWNRSRRLPLDEKKSGGYLTFGLFSHGNMHGLTRKTHDFPFLCRYLNLFGKFHLKEHGAHWTSFSVSVNQAVNLHLDGHNSPGSSNYTCSFGQFDGGQLWVELTEGCNSLSSPVRWKTKRNGQRVPGHLHSTRHRFVQFDPKSFHATDRWTGLRISLTFYTSRLIAQSDETTRTSLRRFGFPLPRSVPRKDNFEDQDFMAEGEDDVCALAVTQDVRDLVHHSCQEVWDEVNSLLDAHGRDAHYVQVVELGGPRDSRLCQLLCQQGGTGYAANLQSGFDLGTKGGFQRALQQLRELRPQVAWIQLPTGPARPGCKKDSERTRSLHHRHRKVVQHVVNLSQNQVRHGECVWISEKTSSAWRDLDACHMWQQLAEDGRAFEWQCGDFQVRTTSKVLFMECSRVTGTHESREASLDGLYRAVCGSLMNVHGAVNASDVSGMAYAVASQKEALEGVTKSELEGLLDTVQKLHRRFGHPTNSLLVKNLRARGASPKLLAVAAEFKCDVCLENQIRSSAPSASLEREDRLWCALQIDGFYMRFGQEVFHFLLMVDEASGFCQVEEVMRHSEKESRNVTTAQVVRTLESRWCQLFGFPETIKLDPEGAFRGLDLGEYCASRGIELGFVPAEYHQGISEAERTIGTIRRKIETFLRAEQYAPSRAAAQLVAAHNTLARTSGFSPAQWAFGRDASITGHSRERDGEMCARSAMADPSHAMHEALELRTKAEKAFLEYRARDLASRALNSKTRPSKHFLPGDIIFYQRFQTPQDTPANTTVDRPRLNIARFYGPGRVLATETRVESEDGVRKAGAIVWAVCNGRLKKFHHSQVRHASETERLVAEGSNAVAFPWTFASLADLLEKGSYDDESIPRHRPRGRSRTPARSRSLPPTARRRIDMPEPPVPQDSPSLRLPEDPPEDEELIEVPASSGAKRDAPEPSMDEDMELIPAPDSKGGDGASSINMARFLNDPQYFPVNFVNLEAEDEASLFQIASTSENHEACSGSVLAVTLEAPATEAEWKSLVKNPKKFLAKSVQKGVEVSYAKLNPQQRRAMDEAMKVEVDNWMKTMAVKAARQYVPQRELLKMRWVLTFKSAAQESNDDNGGSSGVHKDNATKGERIKAKARIVILGYSDPNLLEATTVSPAMTRLSRQLLLNMAAVKKWDILCGDVKSAFLQAKSPQADRCIFAAPVPELSKALNLREGQAVQLLRSVYGLVSAPREWYEDVHKTLGTLGAERLATDNCVWRVRDSNTGQIVGLVSSHVDDFLMCGDNSSKVWKDFLFAFGKSYEWSPWEYGHFKHCGVSIMQHPDSSISLDHSAFCQELKQMNPIRGERKLTAEEVSQVKAILGSVQWRVYQTAPQHAAKLSYLQSLIASQDSSIVEQVNKLIREVYASRSLGVQVQALGAGDPEDLCMVGWSDASLANRPDLSSTGGYMIGIMNRRALEAGSGRVNPVSWRSGKLHRIARSSLSAEAQSLADTEQELFFARLEWREMLGDQLDLRQPESCASKVSAYLIVDAKAMFDSLSKGVFVSSQKDKYTGLELLALSQRLEAQKTVLLWCDSDHMLADGLTKASKQDVLKRFLSHGTWRIRYDGAFISAKRRRQMRQTEDSQGAAFLLFNDPLYSADM